jgi:GT2 family glycosyltransferase
MSRQPSVSAVITYHESPDTLARVLDALMQQTEPLSQIVVVDNGSRQEMPALKIPHPQVSVIRLPENTGLTHARNVGLAAVSSELVLLLDDDIYLAPGCLDRMTAAMHETGAAVICPRIVYHPGDSVIQCDGASIHFAGMLALNHKDESASVSQAQRLDCGAFIGACILAKRAMLADLGGFDEDYFFYFEDLELSYRLRARGEVIWCEPQAVVSHDRGRGTPDLSFRGEGSYPRKRAYLTLRHRWLTMALHFQLRSLLLLSPALALYELTAFAECLRRGWLREWFKAAWSLMRRLPKIAARRSRWQSERVVRDRRILVGGPLPFADGVFRSRAAARFARLLGAVMEFNWRIVRPCL